MSELLTAGPDLDAAIAVEVLDYRWAMAKKCEWFTTGMGRGSSAANRLRQGVAWLVSVEKMTEPGFFSLYEIVDLPSKTVLDASFKSLPGQHRWGFPEPYSTDPTTFFRDVVPAMGERGWFLHLANGSKTWHVSAVNRQKQLFPRGYFHKNIATAGCLAALAAARCEKGASNGQ